MIDISLISVENKFLAACVLWLFSLGMGVCQVVSDGSVKMSQNGLFHCPTCENVTKWAFYTDCEVVSDL